MASNTTATGLRARYERLADGDVVAPPATISEMIHQWLDHCRRTFPLRGGRSSTYTNVRDATRELAELYSDLPLSDLRVKHLKAVRCYMIDRGLCRRSINDRMSRIRTMLRHFEQWVPPGDLTLPGLRRGRSAAVETRRKCAVPILDVLAVLQDPRLSPTVKAMVRLGLRTVLRPGELCQLRGDEIDTAQRLWVYRPQTHKMAHLDRDRLAAFGSRAQLILLPYLNDGYLFTVSRGRRKGQPWTVGAYGYAIRRSCLRMGVPIWGPQQVRRRATTDAALATDEETARQLAGHADVRVTRKHYIDPMVPPQAAEYAARYG